MSFVLLDAGLLGGSSILLFGFLEDFGSKTTEVYSELYSHRKNRAGTLDSGLRKDDFNTVTTSQC